MARVALPAYALGKMAGIASVPVALGATLVLGALITFGAGRLWPSPASHPVSKGRTRNGGAPGAPDAVVDDESAAV